VINKLKNNLSRHHSVPLFEKEGLGEMNNYPFPAIKIGKGQLGTGIK
jgi:hypothetical protein